LANIANAWTSPVGHDALGASTAIFAAVGVIGGLRALQGRPGRVFLDSILPLGAGLGILAMLGTSGANTDIGGHFWGFGLGLAWGSLFGAFLRLGWSPTPSSNRLAGLLALGLICSCWGLALGNHL
jgi:hypothetical protein